MLKPTEICLFSPMMKLFALSCVFLLFLGCASSSWTLVGNTQDIPSVVAELSAHFAEKNNLSGRFLLKQSGFLGAFQSADVDLVVQKPNSFYFSIRSFVGDPLFTAVYDGKCFMREAMEEKQGPVRESKDLESSAKLPFFELPMSIQEFVDLLLGEVSFDGGLNFELYRQSDFNRLKLAWVDAHDVKTQITFEAYSTRVIEIQKEWLKGRITIQYTYDRAEFLLADRIGIYLNTSGKEEGFTLQAIDAAYNSEAFLPDVFSLSLD